MCYISTDRKERYLTFFLFCFVCFADKNALLSVLQQLFATTLYTTLHSAPPSPTTHQCYAALFTLLSTALTLPAADLHLSLLSLLSHRQQQLLVAVFQCTAYPEVVLQWIAKVRVIKQLDSMIGKHVTGYVVVLCAVAVLCCGCAVLCCAVRCCAVLLFALMFCVVICVM